MKKDIAIGFYKTNEGLMAYVGMRLPQPLAGAFEWCGWVRSKKGEHSPEAWDSKGYPMLLSAHTLAERVRADHFKIQRGRIDWNVKTDHGAEYAAEAAADKLRQEEAESVE